MCRVVRWPTRNFALPATVREAAADITAALTEGALTELPVHRFGLSGIVAAHEAAEAGPLGKVLVTP